jgi:hypothetical protein
MLTDLYSLQMSVDRIIGVKRRKTHGIHFVRDDGKFKCNIMFDHLVNSDLPGSELSVERLASEAQVRYSYHSPVHGAPDWSHPAQ